MILVTGATGHIGNVLIRKLLRRKEKVRAMVMPHEDRAALKGLDVEIVEGDVPCRVWNGFSTWQV
jgi:dihydroflavonol-4-reductase